MNRSAIPCPHCHNLHMHRVGCPSPDLLPRYATVFLIEPNEPGAEPLEVLVRDEDVEVAR